MKPRVVLSAGERHHRLWLPALTQALVDAKVSAELTTRIGNPETVSHIVHSPDGPINDFSEFTNLRAVLSLWAGVQDIVDNPTLQVPLARMVDAGMVSGMTEWVVANVLKHHLQFDVVASSQKGQWRTDIAPPLACDRTVAILGFGQLGSAAAAALSALEFNVIGWRKTEPGNNSGIPVLAGEAGLHSVMQVAEILVLLLPATAHTEGILNERTLRQLPAGSAVINAGRGCLIDDDALLHALDSGKLSGATLDVFNQEPLPAEHPYWAHPKVTVSPHIASQTRPATAAPVIADNIRRSCEGRPLLHLVDRKRGY